MAQDPMTGPKVIEDTVGLEFLRLREGSQVTYSPLEAKNHLIFSAEFKQFFNILDNFAIIRRCIQRYIYTYIYI